MSFPKKKTFNYKNIINERIKRFFFINLTISFDIFFGFSAKVRVENVKIMYTKEKRDNEY